MEAWQLIIIKKKKKKRNNFTNIMSGDHLPYSSPSNLKNKMISWLKYNILPISFQSSLSLYKLELQ
jgi:hypothetical protein